MGVEEARARFERVAFAQFLGVSIVEVSHERAVLRLPFQEDNANQGSVLHGGATASLIHMAGTLAAWTDIDLQAAPLANTVNLAIQYLDAAFDEEITAEAMVLHRGPPRMVMSRGTYTLVPLLPSWTLPPPMPPGVWCNRKAPVGQPSGCN